MIVHFLYLLYHATTKYYNYATAAGHLVDDASQQESLYSRVPAICYHTAATNSPFEDKGTTTRYWKFFATMLMVLLIDVTTRSRIMDTRILEEELILLSRDPHLFDSFNVSSEEELSVSPGIQQKEVGGALFSRDRPFFIPGSSSDAQGEKWKARDAGTTLLLLVVQEESRQAPQYPPEMGSLCYDDQQCFVTNKNEIHRRVSHNAEPPVVTHDVAMKVCAHCVGEKIILCVEDVMATGDIELSIDPFYNI